MHKRCAVLYVVVALLGLITAVWTDAQVRAATNPYIGSLIYGQGWWIALASAVGGLLLGLFGPKRRTIGLAMIILAGSFGIGLMAIASSFPYESNTILQSADRGWPVSIQFREGTTAKEENEFLCRFVYSVCTSSGHDLPSEIIGISRTASDELRIYTTAACSRTPSENNQKCAYSAAGAGQ
jgi:hypothetical protein